ncbi:heterokaryon incompatibility protein-domain-containing protein [Podospora aff. communis PSN243]|uniref:Heterokaryon incompatibility protein-domain-containing protein n=1 Tax=Podospora aff. communis PSN243 TaxID=3040156 RepID=A0AAV9GGA7_9PEZI|nr:heterokaryon incompatibility protein-domain-containing protein [Podospora aff. communis PSN243]
MKNHVIGRLSTAIEDLDLENDSEPRSPYDGQDIDAQQDHIRLLTLLPGTENDPISCTTAVVNLSSKPTYTALSYVWGDASDRLPITFNTIPGFPITRNLHTALLHLRNPTSPRQFWIDALCINQDHANEKPHQIHLMGDIYKSASSTCIWLGPSSPTSDLAMALIRALDGANLSSPANSPSPAGLVAIAELQSRPWWSRVWVIQEALLSPHPTVRCGYQSLPMESFMVLDDIRRGWHRPTQTYQHSAFNAITNLSVALRNPFSGIVTYWPDARTRLLNPTADSSPSTLAEWAYYLSDFEATDPRDKIYGLLGLASETDRKIMKFALENDMAASQVYTRAMMWFLMTARNLLQLSFDTDSRASCPVGETGRTLPSWVIDFSENTPEPEEGEVREGGWFRPGYVTFVGGVGYNATGDGRVVGRRVEGDMFPFEQVLAVRVRGCVVDRVAWVGGNGHVRLDAGADAAARRAYSMERMRRTGGKVEEWEGEVMEGGWGDPYGGEGGLDGRSRGEVFRRTLVADRNGDGEEFEWDDEWETMLQVFLGKGEMPRDGSDDEPPTDEALLQYLMALRLALIPRTSGRNFIITSKGYLGLAPIKSKVGDEVCVLEGGTVPYVLRAVDDSAMEPFGIPPAEGRRFFNFIGESYVHGVSDGAWINRRTEEDVMEVLLV